ncbi:MAG: hypothetical protein QXP01_07390 [Candidatus Hadarchaeum sp.]
MKTVKEAGLTNWLRSHSSWVILGITILLAVALYAIVFWYQAGRPSREQAEQVWPAAGEAPCLIAGSAYTVELSLIYPQRLLYEPSAPSRPVSIRLQARTVPTESEEMEGWTVAFSWPDQGIVFTDQAGAEIAPRVVITPSVESVEPAVLYVRRSALLDVPDELSLTMRVYEPSNNVDPWSTDLPVIELESKAEAFWRRFWDMVLGPATPLVLLVPGLLAFGVREWQEGRERLQKKREKNLAEIESLRDLRSDMVRAARKYNELKARIRKEHEWYKIDSQKRLEEIWESLFTPRDLEDGAVKSWCGNRLSDAAVLAELAWERDKSALAGALRLILKDQTTREERRKPSHFRLRGFLRRIWRRDDVSEACTSEHRETGAHSKFVDQVREIACACLVVDGEYHREAGEKIAIKLSELTRLGEEIFLAVAEELERYSRVAGLVGEPSLKEALGNKLAESSSEEEREAAKRLLDKLESEDWLSWRPEASPNPSTPLTEWLKKIGLQADPFWPEEAELDPYLAFYKGGPIIKQIDEKKPSVLFAPPGSGRTAAALCVCRSYQQGGIFPVYYVPPIETGNSRCAHLLEMARVTAAKIACYLSYHSEGFLALSLPRQHNLARLLSLWASSPGCLEAELQRLAPEWGVKRSLIYTLRDIYPAASLQQELSEEECLDLLDNARPCGFDGFYWIIDPPGLLSSAYILSVVQFVHSLYDLGTRLASRRVYVKLLLPDSLVPYCRMTEAITLKCWDNQDLAYLLDTWLEKRAASEEPLESLFYPSGSEVVERLVEAADGSPRRLTRLGHALLEAHARRWVEEHQRSERLEAVKINAQWAMSFLDRWKNYGNLA